jgi:hypothetical protein
MIICTSVLWKESGMYLPFSQNVSEYDVYALAYHVFGSFTTKSCIDAPNSYTISVWLNSWRAPEQILIKFNTGEFSLQKLVGTSQFWFRLDNNNGDFMHFCAWKRLDREFPGYHVYLGYHGYYGCLKNPQQPRQF